MDTSFPTPRKDSARYRGTNERASRSVPALLRRLESRIARYAAAAACLSLLCSLGAASAAEIKDGVCLECHSDKELKKTDAAGKEVSLFVDAELLKGSVHKEKHCTNCHSDITAKHPDDEVAIKLVDCSECHKEQSESFGASVHGLALADRNAESATCVDCHGTHRILPPTSAESPLHFSRLAQTCGECHEQAARDVAESIHGKALAAGHREAPTCTDCHFEHKIIALRTSSPLKISADVCSNCHASERMNTKYRLPPDRVKTFFDSYHGLAAQYGSTVAANCGSCHGAHKVLPSSDPESTINPNNLVVTCGKCHPGATENFARSKVHVDAAVENGSDGFGQKVNRWVRSIYLVLIWTTIGLMLTHNLLIFGRKVRARYRTADFSVTRMDRPQRVQHFILAFSFIVLAVTGFALRYPESWIARAMGSSELIRSWTHRSAGVVLLAVGAYHVYYLVRRREGRRLLKDLFPTFGDLNDALGNAKYLTGLSTKKPLFGRFGYAEKVEYWAVVWGTIIMGVTGLMIWFKLPVTQFLPRWAVDVALTIHYYEAVLACLAILVWHFYHVMFDPDVYPINWACWNGKVSKHWQEEEHPGAAEESAQEADSKQDHRTDESGSNT